MNGFDSSAGLSRSEILNCISNVQMGSQNDFSLLLRQYEPLVAAMVSNFSAKSAESGVVLTHQDIEDVKQEILMVFYNAALTYDFSKSSVEFGLYAKICINRALISLLRKQSKSASLDTVSFEADMSFLDDSDISPAEYYRQEEDAKDLTRLIEKSLSEYENSVWKYYLRGLSSKDIAVKLGKKVSSIDNAIFRIRSKLKTILQNK